jgi:Ser/Thr protein kinase RdoA (MazF antagonist)
MSLIMFKTTWEKSSTKVNLPPETIRQMVSTAYPSKELISAQLIAGGCANLNVKINLKGEQSPLILRVYIRDQAAAHREQQLARLLKDAIPMAEVYSIGSVAGYQFVTVKYLPGITIREAILSKAITDVYQIMHSVGITLSKISAFTFAKSGFFDEELNINTEASVATLINHCNECLQKDITLAVLGPKTIAKITHYLNEFGFPSGLMATNLVHGDFDPANILVENINGNWQVSGVLDLEFAFAGSSLWDIANMLRYAHKMPPEFENGFLAGLTASGATLPTSRSVYMLNIVSLLDCLARADISKQPNTCADIRELINHFLQALQVL